MNLNFTDNSQRFDSQIDESTEAFSTDLDEQDQTFSLYMGETEQTFDAAFESAEQGFALNILTGDIYRGAYEVTPKTTGQTLPTKSKVMADNVNVYAIPYFEVGNVSGGSTVYIGGNSEIQIE